MASIVKFARLNILPWAKFMTGQKTCVCSQRHNSNRASIKRLKQRHYVRRYDLLLVNPDGSSIRIRHENPKQILKLPANSAELTTRDKEIRQQGLNPPEKVEVVDENEEYDISSYSKLLKNKI